MLQECRQDLRQWCLEKKDNRQKEDKNIMKLRNPRPLKWREDEKLGIVVHPTVLGQCVTKLTYEDHDGGV